MSPGEAKEVTETPQQSHKVNEISARPVLIYLAYR
jgi:hypothetical protein